MGILVYAVHFAGHFAVHFAARVAKRRALRGQLEARIDINCVPNIARQQTIAVARPIHFKIESPPFPRLS